LLFRGNAFLILKLGLDILDGIIRFNVESGRFTGQGLDEDLHRPSTKLCFMQAQAENGVEGRTILDVVIRKGTAVLELFSREDSALLFRGNAFLILKLGLDILDGIIRFNVESGRFTGQGLDEDLHRASTKLEDEMEGRLLLNMVIRESASVFKLLASEDETLSYRRDTYLVLDFSLDIVDGVIWHDVENDRLTVQRLEKDLHCATTPKSAHRRLREW